MGPAFVPGDELRTRVPFWLLPGVRAAVAALAVYLAVGALLVAGSLAVHHERVTALSREVGGGWSGVPILVLGVLAAPNAAIAGAGYLSGAGFAVGTATTVSLTGSTAGLVPAFPLLGALPGRDGSGPFGWALAVAAPLMAGAVVAVIAGRADDWRARWSIAGASIVVVAVLGCVLAWQGGGGIGTGTLRAVGTSPWRFPLLTAAWTVLAAAAVLGLRAGVGTLRGTLPASAPNLRAVFSRDDEVGEVGEVDEVDEDRRDTAVIPAVVDDSADDDPDRRDHLAG